MSLNQLSPLTGLMVWDRLSIGSNHHWIVQLTDRDIEEIDGAVRHSIATDKPIGKLTRDDFPFKKFGEQMLALQEEILNGRGFALIRGLPSERWTDEFLIRAYWGIGTWMGEPVPQNAKAHLLGHVIDQRASTAAGTRIYQTNQAQPFHSDSCDIVGLLCLRSAKEGGASSVASSAAIHNALLDTDPDALQLLYKTFQCDRYGEIPEGKQPFYPVNIFNKIDGKLVCCGMDPDIRSAQRLDEVSPLTSEQLQALDSFQKTAQRLSLNMSLQRGDIQLVNNLVAVHAREKFIDHPEPERRRYLIRLWLSSNRGRRLPEFLGERWGNIEPGSTRGGIRVPGAIPTVRLKPDQ